MAIIRLNDSFAGELGTTNVGLTIDGMDYITEVTFEESAGTVVRAKDGAGDVKAVLIGKTIQTMQASGYGSIEDVPALSDGTGIAVSVPLQNFNGKVSSFGIERTAEDFARFSVSAESK